MRKVPKQVLANMGLSTQRQFKQRKRQELKKLIEAFEEYRLGCAFCPYDGDAQSIDFYLKRMKQTHSVKEWGR